MSLEKQSIEAELLTQGAEIIIKELAKIKAFKQAVHNLADKFKDMAELEEIDCPLDVMVSNGKISDRPGVINRMKEYVDEIDGLACNYNLRCDWIINGIHQLVRNEVNPNIKTPIENWYFRKRINQINVPVNIYADTREKDVRDLIKKKWKEVKSKHPELRSRHRDDFSRYVGWLCRRLFWGEAGKVIGNRDHFTAEFVDIKIYQTAKQLGITLPRGRPVKRKKHVI
jgi:hypothetical protein